MSASDDLKKLSHRAKSAEDHAAAAKNQARAELEQRVTSVRNSASGAKELRPDRRRRPASATRATQRS
jgi:hypothetical protein